MSRLHGSKVLLMFVIRAAGRGVPPHYLVQGEGRQQFRWARGDDGLHAATRYSSEEEAGIVAIKRERSGVPARVVWDSLSEARQPSRRRTGFIIRSVHATQGVSFVVMKDGVFQWQRGQATRNEAFRFSSQEAAARVIGAGFIGAAGGTSEIVEVR